MIPDRNPTAFTYGILRANARIVVTDGLFEFLNEEEQRAVVAHELGHIVNRDFIVMTAAGTLVQILYQVYAASMRSGRSGSDKNKGGQALVGLAALAMYYVGIYLLYYLSRTREYLADAFSAERVEARHLASALVKVAYGIVQGGGYRRYAKPVAEHPAHGRHRREERALFRASRQRAAGCGAPSAPPRRCCSTRTILGRASSS